MVETIRDNMSLQELIESDEMPHLGFGELRAQRLSRTSLSGDVLVDLLLEEFYSEVPYRLC